MMFATGSYEPTNPVKPTYTIPKGATVYRHDMVGNVDGQWIITDRKVTYDIEDVVWATSSLMEFRLPKSARPWTRLKVYIPDIIPGIKLT